MRNSISSFVYPILIIKGLSFNSFFIDGRNSSIQISGAYSDHNSAFIMKFFPPYIQGLTTSAFLLEIVFVTIAPTPNSFSALILSLSPTNGPDAGINGFSNFIFPIVVFKFILHLPFHNILTFLYMIP